MTPRLPILLALLLTVTFAIAAHILGRAWIASLGVMP